MKCLLNLVFFFIVEGEMHKLKAWVGKMKSIAVQNEKTFIKAVRGGAYGGACELLDYLDLFQLAQNVVSTFI